MTMGERQFIALLRQFANDPAARGLADDTAVLEVGGEALILTHDMMVEGVHWPATADPADVAWKLAAVNLSDLAATGAEPLGVLLGYALGDETWDRAFVEGLRLALDAFDVPLLGGDSVAAGMGAKALGLTAIGRATHRPVPSRAGARAGDALWLCGDIGAAMAGYEIDRAGGSSPDSLCDAFFRPRPLLTQGRALAPHVNAMMDVSDGLLLDARRMAEASGLAVSVDSEAVPLPSGFSQWLDGLAGEERAEMRTRRLRWGDDYALIFAAPADLKPPVAAFPIGQFVDGASGQLVLDGLPLAEDDPGGYLH